MQTSCGGRGADYQRMIFNFSSRQLEQRMRHVSGMVEALFSGRWGGPSCELIENSSCCWADHFNMLCIISLDQYQTMLDPSVCFTHVFINVNLTRYWGMCVHKFMGIFLTCLACCQKGGTDWLLKDSYKLIWCTWLQYLNPTHLLEYQIIDNQLSINKLLNT